MSRVPRREPQRAGLVTCGLLGVLLLPACGSDVLPTQAGDALVLVTDQDLRRAIGGFELEPGTAELGRRKMGRRTEQLWFRYSTHPHRDPVWGPLDSLLELLPDDLFAATLMRSEVTLFEDPKDARAQIIALETTLGIAPFLEPGDDFDEDTDYFDEDAELSEWGNDKRFWHWRHSDRRPGCVVYAREENRTFFLMIREPVLEPEQVLDLIRPKLARLSEVTPTPGPEASATALDSGD